MEQTWVVGGYYLRGGTIFMEEGGGETMDGRGRGKEGLSMGILHTPLDGMEHHCF